MSDDEAVLNRLDDAVERLEAEAAQWKALWRQNTENAAEAMRERDEANAKLAAIREHLESESARFARQVAEARSYASGLEAERRKTVVDKALAILDGVTP